MDKMSLFEFKQFLIGTGAFRRINGNQKQYTCSCPSCGDNRKHMGVKLDLSSDDPVFFNCFKCGYHGIINKKFLESLNIDVSRIPKMSFSSMSLSRRIDTDNKVKTNLKEFTCDENTNISNVCRYIESRVGTSPTLKDLQSFLYMDDPASYANDFLVNNKIDPKWFDVEHRSWFRMTNGNILGRWHDDKHDHRWFKLKADKLKHNGIYVAKFPFDVSKTINVYIAEGIMDVIGLYYNYISGNNIYIAVLGNNYISGINYLLNAGIFGLSVNIKIFKDPNIDVKNIYINPVVRNLFGKIDIYQNILGYDYGVLPDKIEIQKCL